MSGMADLLKDYVEDTTKQIVDAPDEVIVTSSISTKAVIIQIKVEKYDCGKIIGKREEQSTLLKFCVWQLKTRTILMIPGVLC